MHPYVQRLYYVQEFGLEVAQILVQIANIIAYDDSGMKSFASAVIILAFGAALALPIYVLVRPATTHRSPKSSCYLLAMWFSLCGSDLLPAFKLFSIC